MSETSVQDTPVQGELIDTGTPVQASETPTVASTDTQDAASTEPAAPEVPSPSVVAKAPEGATVNSDYLEKLTTEAQANGWSQAQVDKAVELNVAEMDGYDAAANKAWEDTQAQWDAEAAKDPSLKDYDTSVAPLFEKYANEEDMKLLNESGVLKIPAIKRIFAGIAKAAAEDKVAGTANGAAPTQRDNSMEALASSIYDNPTSRGTG